MEEFDDEGECVSCGTIRKPVDLNLCTWCGDFWCDTCPPFCSCDVERALKTIRDKEVIAVEEEKVNE